MAKVVGYIRVSTQGQVGDGYSLAYQRDEIMRCCADYDIELVRYMKIKALTGPRWTKKD